MALLYSYRIRNCFILGDYRCCAQASFAWTAVLVSGAVSSSGRNFFSGSVRKHRVFVNINIIVNLNSYMFRLSRTAETCRYSELIQSSVG